MQGCPPRGGGDPHDAQDGRGSGKLSCSDDSRGFSSPRRLNQSSQDLSGFPSNDTVNWGSLGTNSSVPAGTSVASNTGFMSTTISFRKPGANRAGSTYCEVPGSGCNWNGDFAAAASLLTTHNLSTTLGQGGLDLTFAQGIANVGFQIQADAFGTFKYVVEAFDGNTLLGTFFGSGFSTNLNDGSAPFFGLEHLTAADITSIKINAYQCAHGRDPSCSQGFAISNLLVQDTTIPEPAGLLLLGSGLGVLALLRRKFAARGQTF